MKLEIDRKIEICGLQIVQLKKSSHTSYSSGHAAVVEHPFCRSRLSLHRVNDQLVKEEPLLHTASMWAIMPMLRVALESRV